MIGSAPLASNKLRNGGYVRSLASSGAAGVMVALLVACWLLLDYPWEITPSRYSDSRAASVGPLERWIISRSLFLSAAAWDATPGIG